MAHILPSNSLACSFGQIVRRPHTGLDDAECRQQAAIRFGNQPQKAVGLRLPAQNGDERRAVNDDHTGKPSSSYKSASVRISWPCSRSALRRLISLRSSNRASASCRTDGR